MKYVPLLVMLLACRDAAVTSPQITPLPTDRRITFTSHRDGNLDIYVMDADGGFPVYLTRHAAADQNSHWSPDGFRIAFTSNRDGDDEIYVMNVDGTGLVRFTRSPGLDVLDDWRR